ncbi:MAG: NYN domain-containing protein, partial [Thermoanaerobaculia bacterium]
PEAPALRPVRSAGRDPAPSRRRTRTEEPAVLPDREAAPGARLEDVAAIERNHDVNDERKIAMFCDLENIALGVRDSADVKKFDINLVLERLLEKGKIIVKRAYADWERYGEYKRPFHEAAVEMIDIPQKRISGKNSADIKMVVDAMDLSFSKEHLDTFAIVSGDSDFSPLVSKLKENNKYVIGVGVKNSSSNLLVDNCDEFIYYEDVWRGSKQAPMVSGVGQKQGEAFSLMVDAIQALQRENKDVLWGSMIKQTMQRKKPSFSEGYYGYGSFSELLEDAETQKLVKLKKDQRSGTYIVTGFANR